MWNPADNGKYYLHNAVLARHYPRTATLLSLYFLQQGSTLHIRFFSKHNVSVFSSYSKDKNKNATKLWLSC